MPGRFAAGAFLLPPPRKWGRGTTLRSKVVEGASDSPFHFRRRKFDAARAPSTTLRSLRSLRAVPLPRYRGGGRQAPPFSRRVFLRTRVIGTPFLKTTPPTQPSSDAPGSGTAGRTMIGAAQDAS